MVNLPSELIDFVMQELHPTSESPLQPRSYEWTAILNGLRACTLVCRSWRFIATSYLFRNLFRSFTYVRSEDPDTPSRICAEDFRIHHQDYHWDKINKEYRRLRVPQKTLSELAVFVAEHAHVRASIQHLKLTGYADFACEDSNKRIIDPALLILLINLLPNLRSLELVDVITHMPALPRVESHAHFLSIQPLDFVGIHYSSSDHPDSSCTQLTIIHILACFSAIGELQVPPMPRHSDDLGPIRTIALLCPDDQIAPHLRPRKLDLDMRPYEYPFAAAPAEVAAYLIHHPAIVAAVRELCIYPGSVAPDWTDHLWTSSSLLGAVGPTLESLEIFLDSDRFDVLPQELGLFLEEYRYLDQCRKLRSIKIVLEMSTVTPPTCRTDLNDLAFHLEWISNGVEHLSISWSFDIRVRDCWRPQLWFPQAQPGTTTDGAELEQPGSESAGQGSKTAEDGTEHGRPASKSIEEGPGITGDEAEHEQSDSGSTWECPQITEHEAAQCADNTLDGMLVAMCQRAGQKQLVVEYSVQDDESVQLAGMMLNAAFPKMKEKGMLNLVYTHNILREDEYW